MWHRGLWHSPVFVMLGLALARVEYEMLLDPPHVQEFRARYGGIEHFTWVPQDGDPWQHIFLRRHWNADVSRMDMELLVWDRIEDTTMHFMMDGLAIQTMVKVLTDMGGSDKRRGAVIRQERAKVLGRTAIDEEGAPQWYAFEGRWIREETAFNRYRREQKEQARGVKGHLIVASEPGATRVNKGANDKQTKNGNDADR